MTNGTLVTLMLGATGLLVAGARLLEDPTTLALAVGIAALLLGIALAAAAVAGAWRTPTRPTGTGADDHDLLAASPRSPVATTDG